MGMPVEKSMTFLPSAKRLAGRLRPERMPVVGVIALGVLSVLLSVIGPRVLGDGTNIIVDGVLKRTGVDFAPLKVVLGMALLIYVFA